MIRSFNPAELEIGSVFADRYRVERCIGVGGTAAVYEVLHLHTHRARALKVMLPSLVADATLRKRFEREATVAARIDSDHIAEVLDAGVDEQTGAPFIVLELLRGRELGDHIAHKGALGVDETLLYTHQVGLALGKTHAAGIVHRDLKPANLFVTYRDDGTPRIKVLDFGIAKVLHQSHSGGTTQGIVGSPLYMAPEQIHGEVAITAAADLYALGHITYAMLVGEPYYAVERQAYRDVMELLLSILEGSPQPPSARAMARRGLTLPPEYDAWFAQATAPQPTDRFSSAAAMVASLRQALASK